MSTKISVSIGEADLVFLDRYAIEVGLGSRSAVVQHAIQLLRQEPLDDEYAAAWQEWDDSSDRTAWESASGDGLVDAPR